MINSSIRTSPNAHKFILITILGLFLLSMCNQATARKGGSLESFLGAAVLRSKPGETADQVLTKEQLRTCLSIKENLSARSETLASLNKQLDSNERERASEARILEVEQQLVGAGSQFDIDRFNDKVHRFNQSVKSDQFAVEAYNRKVQLYEIDRRGFSENCAGKSYYEEDMQALTK